MLVKSMKNICEGVTDLQPGTLLKMNFFTSIYQRFC